MSDELKPDNLEEGTLEYAIVQSAYEVARAIQGVKQVMSSSDAVSSVRSGPVYRRILRLKDSLTRIRRVTRSIAEELKAIEGKQVVRPTDIEPGS
ncbi:hypothetical protein ccbrp13_71610 [Ktedonobacteria bacterium brp13]|nr:hypothetical protein ccbrp13_71610 [Ktedonobacteria bacterium brp13]